MTDPRAMTTGAGRGRSDPETGDATPFGPAVAVPVGRYLGAFPEPDDADHPAGPARRHEIARGDEVEVLTDDEFVAWLLAHGVPGDAHDIAEPPGDADVWAALAHRGLLVRLEPTAEARMAFARDHRLLPLLLGLGPSRRRVGWYGIGLPGRELLAVPPTTYAVWARSPIQPSLWHACVSVAETAAGDRTDAAAPDPRTALEDVVRQLPPLLSVAGVYVDLAEPA